MLLEKVVWTNLNPFGAAYLLDPEHTCANWTSADGLKFARVGYSAFAPGDPAVGEWLSFAAKRCNEAYRIYCIEAKAG